MPALTAYFAQPRVAFDGQLDEAVNTDVLSMLVEETVDGLYRCELRFNNFGARQRGAGFLYFGRDVVDFGKELAVEAGPVNDARQIFQGCITGIEAAYRPGGAVELVVLAEDRLQDLRMTRRTRSFEDVSDEDVISQIAGDHGLTPELTLSGPTHRLVAQVNQSDLAFIRERVRRVGAELWIEGTTLHARSRSERGDDTLNLEYGVNLRAFSVRADLAHQCTELGVSGWDVAAKEAIDETADESAMRGELGSDTGGAAILEQALSGRKERLVHATPLTSDEAQRLAEARYRENARRFVTGAGLADGEPRLRVGTIASLSGLGSLFSGNYYVVRARHTYDSTHGYQTDFDVERPGIGPADI